jgi:hypothetical protein
MTPLSPIVVSIGDLHPNSIDAFEFFEVRNWMIIGTFQLLRWNPHRYEAEIGADGLFDL